MDFIHSGEYAPRWFVPSPPATLKILNWNINKG